MSEQLSDPNPFPEFSLFQQIGQKLIGLCSYFPPTGYRGDHERGAAAMLDNLSPSLNEPTDGEALPAQQSFGFDSEGTYITQRGEVL